MKSMWCLGTYEGETVSERASNCEQVERMQKQIWSFYYRQVSIWVERIILKDGRSHDTIVRKNTSYLQAMAASGYLNICWDQKLQNDLVSPCHTPSVYVPGMTISIEFL